MIKDYFTLQNTGFPSPHFLLVDFLLQADSLHPRSMSGTRVFVPFHLYSLLILWISLAPGVDGTWWNSASLGKRRQCEGRTMLWGVGETKGCVSSQVRRGATKKEGLPPFGGLRAPPTLAWLLSSGVSAVKDACQMNPCPQNVQKSLLPNLILPSEINVYRGLVQPKSKHEQWHWSGKFTVP